MAEIDKKTREELAIVVGHDDNGEHAKKRVRIIKDKKQFSIRIPVKFAEAISIDPEKDLFEFHLEPDKEDIEKVHLTGELVKDEEE